MLNIPPRARLVVIGVSLLCAPLTAAHAQGTRTGGLFGATRADTGNGSQFDVTVGVSEAYDSEVPAEFRAQIPQTGPQSGGFSTMLMTSVQYAKAGRRAEMSGSGQTSFRYYQRLGDLAAVSHTGALGGRLKLAESSSLEIKQSASYSPAYLFQLFPSVTPPALGEAVEAAPDFRVDQLNSYVYGTNVGFALGSLRGNRVSATAEYGHTRFQRETDDRRNLTTYGGSAKYSRGIGRSASASFGYDYRVGEFGSGPAVEHRFNIGFDYTRALATSRRATFRIALSPSVFDVRETVVETTPSGRLSRFHADAGVDYQFRRTWRVGASYRRSVEYLPLLTEPLFANGTSVDVAGLITRRVDVSASAGYAEGESAVHRGNTPLGSYTASTRVRFALLRSVAVYSEYLYYLYDLQGQSGLAPGLAARVEQHGVRAGVMLWLPVF